MMNSFSVPKVATAVIVALPILTGISLGCSDSPPSGPSDLTGDGFRLTAVSPASGPADSVTELSISGSGFEVGAAVTVGDAATDVRVISSTQIKALTPIYPTGTVDLVVTNPGGRTHRLAGAYTYVGFAVTAVVPSRGLAGDLLRIQGTAFSTNAVVTIGGVTVGVIQPTSTQLMVFAPVLLPGSVDVTVTNANGQRRTLAPGFTSEAVVISASPSPVKAGSPLSVTWEVPPGRPASDWIGFYHAGDVFGKEIWWQYTGGVMRGSVTIPAPTEPGEYNFRYFADDGHVEAARTGMVTVNSGAFLAHGETEAWSKTCKVPASFLRLQRSRSLPWVTC